MAGKWLIGTGLTPRGAATPMRTVVSAGPQRFAGRSPVPSLPALHSTAASPRACLTSAPPCDTVVNSPLTGATENASRGHGAPRPAVKTRATFAFVRETETLFHDRALASPGTPPRLQRCRLSREAAGDGADQKWGDVFATEYEVNDGMRDSGEVVPCPSTTIDTDQTRDVVRDSGTAGLAVPGASLQPWSRVKAIPSKRHWNRRGSSGWLFDGRLFGAGQAHLKTQSAAGDR